ncbi:baseplate wedge protein, inner [Synechococcus phage S-CREM2]|nr:baseplate wedge protein, inner [Synechococcus phage S-CREM2]
MSTAGSKVQDTAQEYQYSMPWVTPSGHEFTFYDTPDNERLLVKHASGSHLEFKSDGSIHLKAVKDVHTHTSVLSDQNGKAQGSDNTTNRSDRDYTWEVGGRLKIKCTELDFEVDTTARIKAATDIIMSGNNVQTKATETIALESEKSMYIDAKEMKERVVSRSNEVGTKETETGSTPIGGVNVMKVFGNTIIQNDDPNGGITIASKGYLNLVCGAERVDLIGKFTETPSADAISTFTTKVFPGVGVMNKSSVPGDVYFESTAGAYYVHAKGLSGSSTSKTDGYKQDVLLGNRTRTVASGLENVAITGTQTIKAAMIFLN